MIKHPYYDMDETSAMALAYRLKKEELGLSDSSETAAPSLEQAIRLLSVERATCGFNWITGRVAEEVLRVANGEKPEEVFSPV
jgi:hypothetical protein